MQHWVSTVPDRLAISAVFQYKTSLASKIALGAVDDGKRQNEDVGAVSKEVPANTSHATLQGCA